MDLRKDNLLLKGGHVIDPVTGLDTVTDILIIDGMIERISQNISAPKDTNVQDARGKTIAPGFFDMHVHLREPGYEYKETIETGCLAAIAGGFTGVCCMPNTQPAIDDASVVRSIIERAATAHGGLVDVHPAAAATKGREGKELSPMAELSAAGAVAFTDDGAPIESSEQMRRVLEYASMLGKPVIQHAEDTTLTKGGVMNESLVSTALGMQSMPPVAEEILIARDIKLVKYVNAQYHVAHISTAGSVDLVRSARAKGLAVTCEVTPHHFTLNDEVVRSFDTNTKMNPPLRTVDDVEAMKEGLRDGTISVIATDHAPHTFDEKQVEYTYAPFGIVGLETAVGLALTKLVVPGFLTLSDLISKFSTNPRSILHLPLIHVSEGSRANLTILDTELVWTVAVAKFRSKSKNSPFDGMKLMGKAVGVVNKGRWWLEVGG